MAESTFDWGNFIGTMAGVGAGLYSANQNQNAGQNALQQQTNATNQATNTLNQQQQLATALLGPYQALGTQAAGNLMAGNVQMDPGYQFRQSEGEKAINRANAAGGSFNSASRLKDLVKFNQGNASQGYNDAFNRLMAQVNAGQGSANTLVSSGANNANSLANLFTGLGNAQAGQAIQNANAGNAGLQAVLGGLLNSQTGQQGLNWAGNTIGNLWDSMFGESNTYTPGNYWNGDSDWSMINDGGSWSGDWNQDFQW